MASVSWQYPQDQLIALRRQNASRAAAQPVATGVDISALNFRYDIEGDTPAWRPLRAFDDGAKVYIEFPSGIRQGEMPPLFVIGPGGRLRARQLPRPPELLHRRSPLCRRRAPSRRQEQRAARAHCAHRRKAAAMTDGTQRAPEVTPDLRLRAERAARHAPLAQGADRSWRCGRPRRRRGADLRAANTAWRDQAAKELYTTENRTTAEGVTALPRDYTGIPRLGPPLPGDLGRPILNAQNQGQPVPPTGPLPQPGVTPEEQRRLQEIEAARLSKLFASTEFRATPSLPATAVANATSGTTLAVPAEAPPLDPNSMQNMQDRKLAFVNGPVDRRTVSADRLAESRVALCRAGRHRHSGRADHRHSLRPARPGHGAGHGTCLRHADRQIPAHPPRLALHRPVRQPDRVRTEARPARLESASCFPTASPSCWSASQAPTREGFCGPRGRGRLSLVGSRQGGGALHLARHRHRTRIKRRRKRSRPGATSRRPGFDQQHRPADRAPPAQHPADAHHPPGLPGPRDRQP